MSFISGRGHNPGGGSRRTIGHGPGSSAGATAGTGPTSTSGTSQSHPHHGHNGAVNPRSRQSMAPSTKGVSSAGQVHPATKAGSRLTRSEDLLARIKSYGYVPPRHQQRPEQYDYLFQDKSTVTFLQKLTARITNQNVVPKEEMAQIHKLVAENRAVYGKALETLVERSRKARQIRVNKALEKDAQLQEIKRRIQQKRENIKKLKELESDFIGEQEKRAGEMALLAYQTEGIVKDCQRLRDELSSDNSEEQDICKLISEKFREIDLPPSIVTDISDDTVELENEIRDRMKVKVDLESDLLKQSMTPYEISRRFEQHGKDTERLKHVIIYEIIEQIHGSCRKEVNDDVSKKLKHFRKENERAQRLTEDVRSKMVMEKRESIDRLEKSVNHVMDKKLNQLRLSLVKRFEEETRQIQSQKYESRKQIQGHFKIYAEALLEQFANILICDAMVQVKNQQTLQFMNCLKSFCESAEQLKLERHYLKSPITEENLLPENQAVAKLFNAHRISLETLRSPEATKYMLSLIQLHARRVTEKDQKSKETVASRRIKSLLQKCKDLSKQWKAGRKIRDQWNTDWKNIGALQKRICQLQEETKSHLLNKDKVVKEAIKENESVLAKMKEFLQDRQARVAAEAAAKEAELLNAKSNNRRRSSMFGISFDLHSPARIIS